MAKRRAKANPLFSIQSYYVKCDGKTFGPFKTKAKAKKVAVAVARVLDKPAKIYGKAKNPGRVMKVVTARRKRNIWPFKKKKKDWTKGQFRWIATPHAAKAATKGKRKRKNSWLKRAVSRGGYMVLDGDGLPVHTGRDLSKTEALQMAREARKAGDRGVHLVKTK
jgi:hypothetical protein